MRDSVTSQTIRSEKGRYISLSALFWIVANTCSCYVVLQLDRSCKNTDQREDEKTTPFPQYISQCVSNIAEVFVGAMLSTQVPGTLPSPGGPMSLAAPWATKGGVAPAGLSPCFHFPASHFGFHVGFLFECHVSTKGLGLILGTFLDPHP